MSNSITKLAADAPGVLVAGAQLTRKLASQAVELAQRNEALEHELRLHKIAMRMEDRDLEPDMSVEAKVASLRDMEASKLAGIEAAIEMTPGGFKLASLKIADETSAPTPRTSGGELPRNYNALDDIIRGL